MKDFEEFRGLAKTKQFEETRSRLRAEVVPTRQLAGIVDTITRIHNQAESNPDGFWSDGRKLPVDGGLLIGESGSGKTWCTSYALGILPDIRFPDGKTQLPRAEFIETEAGRVGGLASEIVLQCDGVPLRQPKDKDAPAKALACIRRHPDITLLGIDEVTQFLTSELHGPRELSAQNQLFFRVVIGTLNLGVPMIITGLPHIRDCFSLPDRDEEQDRVRREAQRRLQPYNIPAATVQKDGGLLAGTIASYCALAGVESMLRDDDLIIPRLIHAAFGQIGTALELAQRAVAMTKVRRNSKLSRMNFAIAYKLSTDAVDGANPFLANDWDRIDVRVVSAQSKQAARFKDRVP